MAVKFQELMDCYYISDIDNNQIVYNQLLSLMRKQNITPVIGAGISHWAYPLWREMLETLAKNYGLEEEIGKLVNDGEYEGAASLLERELTHNKLVWLLQQTFRISLLREKATEFPDYLKLLPQLFRGPIITTNFDRAIEYLFENLGIGHPDVVIPSDNFQSEKIKRALHGYHPLLIKIHGDIEDPEHLVLTEETYNNTYGADRNCPDLTRPMPQFLQKALERNPLLFLGCSLNADRTCEVIKACTSGCQQFAFLELPKIENEDTQCHPCLKNADGRIVAQLLQRQKHIIGDLNIQAIWYPYGMHKQAFSAFFTQLLKDLTGGEHIFLSASTPRLISRMPQVRDVFYGRDELIEKIHNVFNTGHRILFLEGIGGIGKSEVAKRFALKYEDEYEHILFMTYTSSLEHLICDPTAVNIENLVQAPGEKDSDFFQRKLRLLQALADEKTLLIIDNFDADSDSSLNIFLEGNYRVIFTTRLTHPGFQSIRVDPIQDKNAVFKIFAENYDGQIMDEERSYIEDIFNLIEYHTYAIELIAKQMSASYLSAKRMLELLEKGQFPAPETVMGRNEQRTAFGHLCVLFDMSNLSDREKQILMYLSLMGIQGVSAKRFQEWAELSSFEIVNQLIKKSWVRRETRNKEVAFSLHSLVREVVNHTLTPSVENCRNFLKHVEKFCNGAWLRPYKENMDIANNIVELLGYFEGVSGKEYQIFCPCATFLWQVGKFQESIEYSKKLYQSCLDEFGQASMETGFLAKAVAGCYFNSGDKEQSIIWYELGLNSMLLASTEDSEDLAVAYEKVARCYTWTCNPNQDFNKANEYFQIALKMHQRLRDALKRGESRTVLMEHESYNLEIAEERIGGTYMEIGRMYFAQRDYKNALECAILQEKAVSTYRPENRSGLAYAYYDQGVCHYYLGLQEKEGGNGAGAMAAWKHAEEKLVQALEINMEMRGTLAIDTIDNQEYLADVHMAISKEMYEKASAEYNKARNMAANLIGTNCDRAKKIDQKMQRSIV